MAHELESDKSFASFRQPAWHGLGTVFTEEVSTKEMLELANLHDWNVRLEEVVIPDGFSSDKTYNYVARTNPFDKNQQTFWVLLVSATAFFRTKSCLTLVTPCLMVVVAGRLLALSRVVVRSLAHSLLSVRLSLTPMALRTKSTATCW